MSLPPVHPARLVFLLTLTTLGCSGPSLATGERVSKRPALVAISPRLAGEDKTEEVIRLLQEGAYFEARALLDEILVDEHLAEARVRLAAAAPEDALVAVDAALALAPTSLEGRLLKADGSLRLAEKAIAQGGNGLLINGSLQDALTYYTPCAAEEPRAKLGAARAAYLLGDSEAAVRWGRAAREEISAGTLDASSTTPDAFATLADVFYTAYVEAKPDETRADEADALFEDARGAIAGQLGRAPNDVAVWARLSDLYEWEENFAAARARLEEALVRAPEDPALLGRLARVALSEGGGPQAIEVLGRYVERNPGGTLGYYHLAEEELRDALRRMQANEYDLDAIAEAERHFVRCRELFPGNDALCRGREALCRGARGWCLFNLDRLEEAQQAFLSMNGPLEGGIRWQWEVEGLRHGVLGLAFIGDRYNQLEDNLGAAQAFEQAFLQEPTNGDWANNAGFFLRDAAEEIEREARRLCRAANGRFKTEQTLDEVRALAGIDPVLRGTDSEPIAFRAAADSRFAQATDLMQRSWDAYQVAAEIYADDVRTVNDAGLIQVYYLHTDVDAGEALLQQSRALGEEQVPALRTRLEDLRAEVAALRISSPDTDELAARESELVDLEDEYLLLVQAWSDAFQNLGVLYWLHRDDDAQALEYLRRSVALGPEELDPRRSLTDNLIPWIEGTYTPGEDEPFDLANWGRPCE